MGRLDAPLTRVVKAGAARGWRGGSQPWLALFILARGLRWLLRQSERRPEVVSRDVLEPGQSLLITHRVETWDSIDE